MGENENVTVGEYVAFGLVAVFVVIMCLAGCSRSSQADLQIPYNVTVARAAVAVLTTGSKANAGPIGEADKSPEHNGYSNVPMRRRWTYTISGRRDNPEDLIRLLTTGQNAGKFDAAWVASLSATEMVSLHSDLRENIVQWDCVVKPPSAGALAADNKRPGRWVRVKQCHNGRCSSRLVWVTE